MKTRNDPGPRGPGAFSFITLGCKSNQYDSAAMAEDLKKAGLEEGAVESAGVIIVNTCMVTGPTEAQCRKAIRKARKVNRAARLVVAGCMSSGVRDQIEAMEEVDHVIEPSQKGHLPKLLGFGSGRKWSDWPEDPTVGPGARDRAILKIQDGCDAACAYCIVPLVRGRSRSLEPETALEAIRYLLDEAVSEVVLSGIHLGQYGYDLDPAFCLEDLLETFLKERNSGRLRLSSIEPLEVTSRLVDILSGAHGSICRHIHIPLQSGSDRVLRAMGRPYTRDQFTNSVKDLISAVPGIGVGCDVICGFPGESEEDFGETMELIEMLKIPYIHAFPFSPRPGTRAASMKDDVPHSLKKERVSAMREIAEKNRISFASDFMGAELDVALESSTDADGNIMGLADNYLRVAVKGNSAVLTPGGIVCVMIEGHDLDGLLGYPAGDF